MSAAIASSSFAVARAGKSFKGSQLPRASAARPAVARRSVIVRAQNDEGPSQPTSTGYMAKDSAGQTNIFSVEPKVYVAGSSRDKGQGKGSAAFALLGGLASIGLVAAGISLVTGVDENANIPTFADEGNFESLSYYKSAFTAAPAPVSAPELSE